MHAAWGYYQREIEATQIQFSATTCVSMQEMAWNVLARGAAELQIIGPLNGFTEQSAELILGSTNIDSLNYVSAQISPFNMSFFNAIAVLCQLHGKESIPRCT